MYFPRMRGELFSWKIWPIQLFSLSHWWTSGLKASFNDFIFFKFFIKYLIHCLSLKISFLIWLTFILFHSSCSKIIYNRVRFQNVFNSKHPRIKKRQEKINETPSLSQQDNLCEEPSLQNNSRRTLRCVWKIRSYPTDLQGQKCRQEGNCFCGIRGHLRCQGCCWKS